MDFNAFRGLMKTTGITLFGFDAYFIIFSQTVGSFWVVIYEGFYPYPRVITLPYPWWLAPKGTLPFNTLWKNLKPYPPLTLELPPLRVESPRLNRRVLFNTIFYFRNTPELAHWSNCFRKKMVHYTYIPTYIKKSLEIQTPCKLSNCHLQNGSCLRNSILKPGGFSKL